MQNSDSGAKSLIFFVKIFFFQFFDFFPFGVRNGKIIFFRFFKIFKFMKYELIWGIHQGIPRDLLRVRAQSAPPCTIGLKNF